VTFGPVYAEVGPQLSLLVGGHETGRELNARSSSSMTEVDRPATERYQRLYVGVCAGLGIQLPIGLGLGLRFVQGIDSLTKGYTADQVYGYDGDIRSRSLQASLMYRLRKAS
jgi:hypothetical protein